MRRPLGSEYSFGCGGPLARTGGTTGSAVLALDGEAGALEELPTDEPEGTAEGDDAGAELLAGPELESGSLPLGGVSASDAKGKKKMQAVRNAKLHLLIRIVIALPTSAD